MSSVKAHLKRAMECLARGQPAEAMQLSKAAAQIDAGSFEAHLLTGKAAFLLEDFPQAHAAYKRAAEINAESLQAWKGLAELHGATGNAHEASVALQTLWSRSRDNNEAVEKQCEYARQLAAAYSQLGHTAEACAVLTETLAKDLPPPQRLLQLCMLADAQENTLINKSSASEELLATLAQITATTRPVPGYARYFEAYINHHRQRMVQHPWSSRKRSDSMRSLLASCLQFAGISVSGEGGKHAINGKGASHLRQGCATPAALAMAVLLTDGRAGDSQASAVVFHRAASRLAHEFPTCHEAGPALGLIHWRRLQASQAPEPSSHAVRARIMQHLQGSCPVDTQLVSAPAVLARLHVQNGNAEGAAKTAAEGLAWLESMGDKALSPSSEAAAALQLDLAQALYKKGQLGKASQAFQAAAKRATCTAQERQAQCGLALVAAASGDRPCAEQMLSNLLGGCSSPEHWLLGEYGWLKFEGGDLEEARSRLEAAAASARHAGPSTADTELMQHRFRLGRVYWKLGGALRTDRQHAHAEWLAAAAVPGPAQAAAFAWLGRYYSGVEHDNARARRCLQRALLLDPCDDVAGEELCALLERTGAGGGREALCRGVAARAPGAAWAVRGAGLSALARGAASEAVPLLQAALRAQPRAAAAWEGLGAAYQAQGHLSAALKAYGRALGEEPSRLYSLVQSGTIQSALGDPTAALCSHMAALRCATGHLPALLGAAEALLAAARAYLRAGVLGAASRALQRAHKLAVTAAAAAGNLSPTWKLLGDIRLQFRDVAPCNVDAPADLPRAPAAGFVAGQLTRWRGRVAAVNAARRAYAKALHLVPSHAGAWGDVAAAMHAEAQLCRVHRSLHTDAVPALGAATERLLHGALALEPGRAALWAALGAAGKGAAVREHALSRALALDPRAAPVWAALARLYLEGGQAGLAATCLELGRSHDPASPAVWEAMGVRAGASAAGARERLDTFEHGARLGGGCEALLGFAEGAARCGRAADAHVYAAACRSTELQPLLPAAHMVRGASAEARGAFVEAAAEYSIAEQLLQEPACGEVVALSEVAGGSAASPRAAAALGAARALLRAGQAHAATNLYAAQEAGGDLAACPPARLLYACALHGCGASQKACRILHNLLSCDSEQVHGSAALALCHIVLDDEGATAAVWTAEEYMAGPIAAAMKAPAMQRLWLALQEGARAIGNAPAQRKVASLMARWQASTGNVDASFAADLLAAASSSAADGRSAVRVLARAVAACASRHDLRVRLARAALAVGPAPGAVPAAAAALCAAAPAPAPKPGEGVEQHTQCHWALEVRVADLLRRRPSGSRTVAEQATKALARWVHAEPGNALAWAYFALVTLRCAAPPGPGNLHPRSCRLVSCAAAMCRSQGYAENALQALLQAGCGT